MRWLVAGLWLALLASCNEESSSGGGGGGGLAVGGGSGSAAAKSGGGFSADLAKEFASSSGSGDAKAGSAATKAGGADPKAGGADPKAGGTDAKAGGADPKAGGADPKAGSAAANPVGAEDTAKVAPGPSPAVQGSGTSAKKVAVPADLAAIKFGMLPNWERDVQDAGTISLAVKIPGRGTSAVFVFRYGYEDPSAPAEREAYKKWLTEKRLLAVRQDRQSSSAWYLEGSDSSGRPAFRFVVNWGGKRLICYGSLYRDAESNQLGDLRDQTVIQAKQICETISL
jgi:hypothetical protein